MPWDEYWDWIVQTLLPTLQEHWAKAAFSVATLLFGIWWGRRRAAAEWKNKEFLDRINISLNIVKDGRLMLRTLAETTLDVIFLNTVAVEKVRAAAKKTTEENALLPLAPEDSWHLLNAVLNEISERFAEGCLLQDVASARPDLTPPVVTRYVICLTCEKAGDMRIRKVRTMLIRKDLLLDLPKETPAFEHPSHITRWETLQTMAKRFKDEPHLFIEMDLAFPIATLGGARATSAASPSPTKGTAAAELAKNAS